MVNSTSDAIISWGWLDSHTGEVLSTVGTHLLLTGIAVGTGFLTSTFLVLIAGRHRRVREVVLALTGMVYTIPSIALFFLLGPLTGYTTLATAEVALVGYTLLILVRNMIAGLDGVPEDVRDAAVGIGYSPLGRLWRVEVPLALPEIITGLRIATVTTIGLVAVAAVIGQGGLGQLILEGLQRDFSTPVVVGAVLSVLLALLADLALLGLQRALSPWARTRPSALIRPGRCKTMTDPNSGSSYGRPD